MLRRVYLEIYFCAQKWSVSSKKRETNNVCAQTSLFRIEMFFFIQFVFFWPIEQVCFVVLVLLFQCVQENIFFQDCFGLFSLGVQVYVSFQYELVAFSL